MLIRGEKQMPPGASVITSSGHALLFLCVKLGDSWCVDVRERVSVRRTTALPMSDERVAWCPA